MYDKPTLVAQLQVDEGKENFPYVDTTSHISIGVGRNLTTNGISDDEMMTFLDNDIAQVETLLDQHLPWWRTVDDVRQLVLMNMTFNMGIGGLLTFVHFLAAVKAGNWTVAAQQMTASRWAQQVGARATRLEQIILTGTVPSAGVMS